MGKNKKNNETLYDRTIRQFKDKPAVVAVLVIGAVLLGLFKFLGESQTFMDKFFPAKQTVTEAQVTIQPYDIASGYKGSPILRLPATGDEADVNLIAENILGQILDVVEPESGLAFKARLEIKGNVLSSDQPLAGDLTVISTNNVTQMAARVQIPDLSGGMELTGYFSDPATFDPECGCIYLNLYSPKAGYQDGFAKIHRLNEGFSFDPAVSVTSKSMDFTVVPVRILLEPPLGQGADQTLLDTFASSLDGALRQKMAGYEFLQLSPYRSVGELRAIVDPLIPSIAPGTGKGNVLDQYRVDFVVTVAFIMK